MPKQTATQWLYDQLDLLTTSYINKEIHYHQFTKESFKLLEESKKMEEQNIKNAYNQSSSYSSENITADEYYHKNYVESN